MCLIKPCNKSDICRFPLLFCFPCRQATMKAGPVWDRVVTALRKAELHNVTALQARNKWNRLQADYK